MASATDDTMTERLSAGIASARDTDPLRVFEQLTDAERAVRDRVRAFVDDKLLPVVNEHWERATFPSELLVPLAALDVVGGSIEGYGCPALSRLAAGLVTAEISRGDGSFNAFCGVQSNLSMGTIALLGSEEQKQRWLPRMAQLELLGAFALTEPGHGSDAAQLETRARRDGNEWVLTGRKRWIGSATFAHLVIVWARDETDGAVKGFVVEREPNEPMPAGYDATPIAGKIGKRLYPQADVTLDGVRVPDANRLTGAQSFRDVTRVLATTRGGAAWECLGHATAAYEAALTYALTREQFDGPIARFQLVQAQLAEMLSGLVSIQLLCVRMAELQQAGEWTGTMASIAKFQAARTARTICAQARDVLGGNGLLLDFHVARHLTDMEVVHAYEGTDSIQRLLIGRAATGLSAFA